MMKKFILRLLLFCLAPLPLLYLLAYIVDKGLQKSRYTYYSEWNDLFNGKINADVLIMGSSRAWVHFSPKIIDSILHVNSYNIGIDASSIGLQYQRLQLYLEHNRKPKYIIQEVNFVSTFLGYHTLPGAQQFLPYLKYPLVWKIVTEHNSTFGPADRYFPLFKYNNEFVLIKEGILSYFGHGAKDVKYKGYCGRDLAWDSSFYYYKRSNPAGVDDPIDSAMVDTFKSYLNFCKANGIKVILVNPPSYIEALNYENNYKDFLAIYDSFSREYQIPFYNYVNDSLDYDRNNFYNSQHMNRQAAEIFCTRFALELKNVVR
jgi:hypothetical protein